MPAPPISRREFAAGFAMSSSLLAAEAVAQPSGSKRSLHVVCVGAHPDDPESGCGGTLARYAAAGHRVTIVYLTRGEAGIPGKTHVEAAAIRTAEAEAACRILGAKPVFAGQIDGATEVTPERTRAFTAMLLDDRPDVVLTHWPIDTHPDHQAASLLALREPGVQRAVPALLLRGRLRLSDDGVPTGGLRRYHVGAGEEEGGPVCPPQPGW